MSQEAWRIEENDRHLRLDQFLAQKLTPYSRSRIQQWIKDGHVRVNEQIRPAHYRLRPGDSLTCTIPAIQPWHLTPEAIALDILYEDDDLLVLNKPPGLTVHPGAGQQQGTLVHALIHHCPDLEGIGDVQRPGLVHRLDKDTSGVMVVAKSAQAFQNLQEQFQARQVQKRYLALVWGHWPQASGTITLAIGRHPSQRHKMAVSGSRGRPAATSWHCWQEFPGPFSLLELSLHTGRTHQIRVHMAALGHPVVGDKVYGGGEKRLAYLPADLSPLRPLVTRQLLHAWRLQFQHPRHGAVLQLEAPLPPDFQSVLDFLTHLP
ncbi:MAG: RluA family pseudouridine synthase [Desulfobacca sp.]|uniref:RluA family pseudouridine synthase n=1 Tax=Desulfobacca sp. TaxID=2067990 RepID=UPI004049F171